MKILELIPSLGLGGAQTLCCSLCKELSKDNVVELLVAESRGDAFQKYLQILDQTNVKVIFLNKKSGFSLRYLFALKKEIKAFRPDIIHSHLRSTGYLLLLFSIHNIPIFHTIHNQAAKDIPPKMIKLLKRRLKSHLWDVTLIGISTIISEQAKALYNPKEGQLVTIFNGILPRSDFIPKPIGGRPHNFITVAGLRPQKNLSVLLDAFSKIKEHSSKLLIVGDGEQRELLAHEAETLGISSRVIFYGALPDPYPLFNEAQIFVQTSLFEGNPIAILEAMEGGLPIIASKVGGVPDVVVEGVNGFLFEDSTDTKKLASLMEGMMDDDSILSAVSNNNLSTVKQYYMEKVKENYLVEFKRAHCLKKKVSFSPK
jgi:glycosyltransferase involved in cell wall biosynthesis